MFTYFILLGPIYLKNGLCSIFSRHRCNNEPILSLSSDGSVTWGSIDSLITAVKDGNDIRILEGNKQIALADNVQYNFNENKVVAMFISTIRTEEKTAFGNKVVAFTVSKYHLTPCSIGFLAQLTKIFSRTRWDLACSIGDV